MDAPGTASVTFSDPSYAVSQSASTTTTHPGEKVTYTVTVTNTGGWAYTTADPARFTGDLSDVLDDAQYDGDASAGAAVTGTTLTWSGALAPGASTTITYSATVGSPRSGNGTLLSTLAPTAHGGRCDPADACTATTNVQSFSITKTADAMRVSPGGKLTYTVTLTNTGVVDYTAADPASFRDDLSQVRDDALYDDDATGGATVSGDTLTWSGPLSAGASTVITYSVDGDRARKRRSASRQHRLPHGARRILRSRGELPHHDAVAAYTVTTSASTPGPVNPGARVVYTITVTNTGQFAYTSAAPATFLDDLSDVMGRCLLQRRRDLGRDAEGNHARVVGQPADRGDADGLLLGHREEREQRQQQTDQHGDGRGERLVRGGRLRNGHPG